MGPNGATRRWSMLRVMPTSVVTCRRTFRKLLISVFASLFLTANTVCAGIMTLNYDVTWKFVTVGTIELILASSTEKQWISLSARTKGPFKFFRAYDVNVVSTRYGSGERTYELKGLDRGVNEERLIRYRDDEVPVVVLFTEIDTPNPLATSTERDGKSVDPFFILAEFLRRAAVGEGCDGEYQVYDAKRRYRVSAITESTNTSILNENFSLVATCRVFLDASSIESAEKRRSGLSLSGLRSLLNVWPFTSDDQVVELRIGSNDQKMPYPLGFSVKTPFGKVIATLRAKKDAMKYGAKSTSERSSKH